MFWLRQLKSLTIIFTFFKIHSLKRILLWESHEIQSENKEKL